MYPILIVNCIAIEIIVPKILTLQAAFYYSINIFILPLYNKNLNSLRIFVSYLICMCNIFDVLYNMCSFFNFIYINKHVTGYMQWFKDALHIIKVEVYLYNVWCTLCTYIYYNVRFIIIKIFARAKNWTIFEKLAFWN